MSSPQRCAPVVQGLQRAGVPLRENAIFLKQNEPELKKLANPGADT